jgi:hypothetical protein
MKNIHAVIVDTYDQNRLAHLAIEKTIQTDLVERIHTFSTAPIYPGEEFHPIRPIESTADYSHFLLNIVPYFVDADAVLVIQWDGMPHSVGNWNDDFLNYDYTGAPWGNCNESVAVGNGGFSMRSRKLMDTLRALNIKCDSSLPDWDAEDVVICKHYRNELMALGCTFSPYLLARTFSVENLEYESKSFGFHGVFNLPLYLPECKLLDTAEELCKRTSKDLFLINFLVRQILQSSERYGRIGMLMRQANFDLPGY